MEEGLKEGGQEKDGIMREAQAGGVPAASKQEPEMVPLHSPAESPMLDDAETPPPPPPRMTMSDMPKDEIEMKHPHSDPTEEEDDDDDVDFNLGGDAGSTSITHNIQMKYQEH